MEVLGAEGLVLGVKERGWVLGVKGVGGCSQPNHPMPMLAWRPPEMFNPETEFKTVSALASPGECVC